MICPNCDHDNFESAVFCSDCGTRLPEGSSSSQPDAYQNTSVSNLHGPTLHVSPRDLGGILNETFVIFRRNFVAFFLIALIAQIPLVLIAIVAPEIAATSLFPELSETFPQAEEPLPLGIEGLDTDLDSEAPSISIAVVLLVLVAIVFGIVSLGAMIHGVTQHYLRQRVDIVTAYYMSLRKFIYLILILILMVLILIIPALLSLLLIGIPVLLFLMVRFYFSFHAVMLERKGPIEALSGSWNLVQNYWWRTFGIGVVFVLVVIGILVLTSLITSPITNATSPVIGSIISALISSLASPITSIGSTLVYLDLRSRKDGSDVALYF